MEWNILEFEEFPGIGSDVSRGSLGINVCLPNGAGLVAAKKGASPVIEAALSLLAFSHNSTYLSLLPASEVVRVAPTVQAGRIMEDFVAALPFSAVLSTSIADARSITPWKGIMVNYEHWGFTDARPIAKAEIQ
jgi:hypothetical protein